MLLVLPLAARLAVRRRAWDAVQSHERTLDQDVYRAGEGCHRAYLDTLGGPPRRRVAYHRLLLALERRVFTPHARDRGDLRPGRRRDRRALRRAAGPAQRRLQRCRPRTLPSRPPHARPGRRARRGRHAFDRVGRAVRGQRVRAQGAGHRAARRWRAIGRPHSGCWSSARATRSRTGSWPSPRPGRAGRRGSAPGPTSSAGTRRPTRWCCPRATSRSATCTSRRSPRDCRS